MTDESPRPRADGDAVPANIWLAGLGALTKAQAEGSKAFEILVREGIAAQHEARTRAQEMTRRMEALNQDVLTSAAPRWPGLEGIFETRVERALRGLGVPDQVAWQNIMSRLDVIEQALGIAKATDEAETKESSASQARRGVAAKRKRPKA